MGFKPPSGIAALQCKVRCKHIEASACCMRSVVWFRVTMLMPYFGSLVKDKDAEGLEAITELIRRRGGPDAERKAAVLRDDWNAQR